MNRDEKLKTFKVVKLKYSIRFVYLNLPFEIDSFKEFYIQNQYFLEDLTSSEIYNEFVNYHFIQLCKKWLIYPTLNKKEILEYFESEMKTLLMEN
jgi:hypothetical protein